MAIAKEADNFINTHVTLSPPKLRTVMFRLHSLTILFPSKLNFLCCKLTDPRYDKECHVDVSKVCY